MRSFTRRSVVLALLAALAQPISAFPESSTYSGAYMGRPEEASAGAMILDLLVARPAGIVATAVGAVAFIVSLPFSGPTGSADVAAEKLVAEPARFTFGRPLGVFEGDRVSN